jgi:hypothetical protein
MLDSFITVPRVLGLLSVVFLPGAWITFGLRLGSWGFYTRLSIGAVLSPIVICAEFYIVRLLGISFEVTAYLLALINLPVLTLIWRRRDGIQPLNWHAIVTWGIVLLVPLACLSGPLMLFPEWRLFCGHPWMHADVVYQFANGMFIPEEPVLAGVVLSYPWAGHIPQAVLSCVLNSPPISSFRWTNLLWLAFIIHMNTAIVRRLGGRDFAALSSAVWLLFGVNILGYLVGQILPSSIGSRVDILGDYRYSPWVLKFCDFNQMPFALGFFSGIAYLMTERWPEGGIWGRSFILFALLLGLGVVYPICLAPAYGVVLGGAVTLFLEGRYGNGVGPRKRLFAIGLAVVLASILCLLNLDWVTQDSSKATMLGIVGKKSMAIRAFKTLIVTFPLVCLVGLSLRKVWKDKWDICFVLISGAAWSCMLHVTLHIPYFSNEYKFIFTAAMCLAPFSGLVMEKLQGGLGRWRTAFVVSLALILAWPFYDKIYRDPFPQKPEELPLLNRSEFNLRLDAREPFSAIAETIRDKTPLETILVMDHAEFHVPTVTRRALFAPTGDDKIYHGFALRYSTYLHGVRGYESTLIKQREKILAGFFNQENVVRRKNCLKHILALGRPVAIILDRGRHEILLNWLKNEKIGECIYAGGQVLWLVRSGSGEMGSLGHTDG